MLSAPIAWMFVGSTTTVSRSVRHIERSASSLQFWPQKVQCVVILAPPCGELAWGLLTIMYDALPDVASNGITNSVAGCVSELQADPGGQFAAAVAWVPEQRIAATAIAPIVVWIIVLIIRCLPSLSATLPERPPVQQGRIRIEPKPNRHVPMALASPLWLAPPPKPGLGGSGPGQPGKRITGPIRADHVRTCDRDWTNQPIRYSEKPSTRAVTAPAEPRRRG